MDGKQNRLMVGINRPAAGVAIRIIKYCMKCGHELFLISVPASERNPEGSNSVTACSNCMTRNYDTGLALGTTIDETMTQAAEEYAKNGDALLTQCSLRVLELEGELQESRKATEIIQAVFDIVQSERDRSWRENAELRRAIQATKSDLAAALAHLSGNGT